MSDILMNDPHGQAMAKMSPLDRILAERPPLGFGTIYSLAVDELATLRRSHALLVAYGRSVAAVHEARNRVANTQEEEDAAQTDYRAAADAADTARADLFMYAHALSAPTPEQQ